MTSLGQINGNVLAQISQDFFDHHEATIKARKKKLSDTDWLNELAAEEVYRTLNVPQQHQLAQAWCKRHTRICTRRFFADTWLKNALAEAPIKHAELPHAPTAVYIAEPTGWRDRLKAVFPHLVDERPWNCLAIHSQKTVIEALKAL